MDTVAALSTAPGAGLRAIIRMSGPDAFSIAKRMTGAAIDPMGMKGFSIKQTRLRLPRGLEVHASILIMRGPKSFTTEDMAEFHIIGAPTLADYVLEICIKEGARLAEPGEFVKRAYLGGRISSEQVECVLSIIESRSEEEQRAAVKLLQGRAAKEIALVRKDLINILAAIEAYLDFTDEDSEAINEEQLRVQLNTCLDRLKRIEDSICRKTPDRNLPKVVILGPPNAGKSTLFNLLAPQGRALISHEPGATRDLLEGKVKCKERKFYIYDAPGVTKSSDPLERLAVSRLLGVIASMDVAIIIFDGSIPPDRDAVSRIFNLAGTNPWIFVLNKCDQPVHESWNEYGFDSDPIYVSAQNESGVSELIDKVSELLPAPQGEGAQGIDFKTRSVIISARDSITEALCVDWEGGIELAAMEIREALSAIGMMTSRITDEEVLNTIFSRFCIGK